MKIAAQLQQGVSMSRIMDNIRGYTGGGITREHLVTKQDNHNIKNHYNIEGVIRHFNDLTSVCVPGLQPYFAIQTTGRTSAWIMLGSMTSL